MGELILVASHVNRVKELASENTRQSNGLMVPAARNPPIEDGTHHNGLMFSVGVREID